MVCKVGYFAKHGIIKCHFFKVDKTLVKFIQAPSQKINCGHFFCIFEMNYLFAVFLYLT